MSATQGGSQEGRIEDRKETEGIGGWKCGLLKGVLYCMTKT